MARPKRGFNRPETPTTSTNFDRGSVPTTTFVKDEIVPAKMEEIPFSDVVVEPEAIVPDSEVTPEMKQEEPINTPETAVPVVSFTVETKEVTVDSPVLKADVPAKSFKERMEECSAFFGHEYFDNVAKSGCDYKAFGDWQKGYCGLLDRVFGIRGKEVLDVGAAYGSLGNGFKQLGAKKVNVVDISKHAISAKVFDGLNYVLAPAQMMKAIASASQDLIHASYLMNSVDSEDLEMTFNEFKRVLAPSGKLFIIMNFGRDNKVSIFDTRHSKEAIVAAATKAGFKEVSNIVNQLRSVDDGRYEFISNYNWGIVCFE
jgi:ubiquinone/menaquinone biosynthesis C-methylase UbiE